MKVLKVSSLLFSFASPKDKSNKKEKGDFSNYELRMTKYELEYPCTLNIFLRTPDLIADHLSADT